MAKANMFIKIDMSIVLLFGDQGQITYVVSFTAEVLQHNNLKYKHCFFIWSNKTDSLDQIKKNFPLLYYQ